MSLEYVNVATDIWRCYHWSIEMLSLNCENVVTGVWTMEMLSLEYGDVVTGV